MLALCGLGNGLTRGLCATHAAPSSDLVQRT
jgi:hypothetical protein